MHYELVLGCESAIRALYKGAKTSCGARSRVPGLTAYFTSAFAARTWRAKTISQSGEIYFLRDPSAARAINPVFEGRILAARRTDGMVEPRRGRGGGLRSPAYNGGAEFLTMAGFVIIVLVALFMLVIAILGAELFVTPEPYCSRSCAGRAWRQAFPNADKRQIRDFLQAFVDAFMFSTADRLHFLPSDAVMDVYRKATGPWVDNMELEFFSSSLEDQFGLDIESRWHDQITLGEIFSHVLAEGSGKRQT